MGMNFTPVAVKTSGAAVVAVSKEVATDVSEAWAWFEKNPGFHLFTDEFEDKGKLDAWVRQAQSHARSIGLRLRVVRDDENAAAVEASGKPKVRFHIETQEAYETRKAAQDAQKAQNEAIKAAGGTVKRGRKVAA